MEKRKKDKLSKQVGSNTNNKDINAGSGGFNQGSEQDLDYNDGTKLSDEEKKTGHTPSPGKAKEKPEDGNIGKNNAG